METTGLLEDTLHLVVKVASAQGPSAATIMAVRRGAFRRAEVPASVAEGRVAAEEPAAAVADLGNQKFLILTNGS
jgi:hypothetical protein